MSNQPVSAVTRTELYFGFTVALNGYCTSKHDACAASDAVGR